MQSGHEVLTQSLLNTHLIMREEQYYSTDDEPKVVISFPTAKQSFKRSYSVKKKKKSISLPFHPLLEDANCKIIIESLELEETLKGHLVQHPSMNRNIYLSL